MGRRIRVLYDASLAQNPAGTGTFVRGLLRGLQAHPELDVIATSFESHSAATLDTRQKSAASRVRNSLRHAAYYLRDLPQRARAARCDVIFCPSGLVPVFGGTPLVMTIFDLTPLRFGGTQDWLSRRYAVSMLRLGVRRSSAVCTISGAVRDEIVAQFPAVSAGSVHVAYPGPNPELLAAPETRPSIPDRPFVLIVGTVEPRKNHITAVRALAEHCRQRPASPLILVAAGSAGWLYEPVDRAIRELGLRDRVIRIGNVEPGSLKWLYRHATALLFPSLYEGFGLPVLEALSLECPLVASRIPSVAEITGDGAMLLDPTAVPAWTAALAGLEDGRGWGLAPSAGLDRARRFTWEGCAESALAAISGALGSS